MDFQKFNILKGIQLADTKFFTPDKVYLLLGAEYVWDILRADS